MKLQFVLASFIICFLIISCKKQSTENPPGENELENGLIAYYPFNSNTNDETGNDYNLENRGAVLTGNRKGLSNKAFLFDGLSSFMIIPPILKGDSLRELTMSLWIQPVTPSDDVALSFRIKKDLGCSSSISVTSNASTLSTLFTMPFSMSNGSNCISALVKGETALGTSPWFHIVLIQEYVLFNNSYIYQYHQYVNGKKLTTTSSKLGVSVDPVSLASGGLVGGNNNSGNYGFNFNLFKGAVDDIRIYNRQISDSEIQKLYQLEE